MAGHDGPTTALLTKPNPSVISPSQPISSPTPAAATTPPAHEATTDHPLSHLRLRHHHDEAIQSSVSAYRPSHLYARVGRALVRRRRPPQGQLGLAAIDPGRATTDPVARWPGRTGQRRWWIPYISHCVLYIVALILLSLPDLFLYEVRPKEARFDFRPATRLNIRPSTRICPLLACLDVNL